MNCRTFKKNATNTPVLKKRKLISFVILIILVITAIVEYRESLSFMKVNKLIKSFGVGMIGVVMMAASAISALAASGYEPPLRTTVSGKVTYPNGSWVSYANMAATCYYVGGHGSTYNFNSNLYGQYTVSIPSCKDGSYVYVQASIGNTSVHWSGSNNGFVYNHLTTVNVTVYQQ